MGLLVSLLLWGMEWLPHYCLIRVKGQILHIIATDIVQLLEAFCVVFCFVLFVPVGVSRSLDFSSKHGTYVTITPLLFFGSQCP